MKGHFTVLPFLMAMMIAVAAMPTNVIQACFGELGIEYAQPWRSKTAELIAKGRAVLTRMCEGLSGWSRHRLAIPLLCLTAALVLMLVSPSLGHGATLMATTAPVMNIKQLRQDVADNVAAQAKLKVEGRQLVGVAARTAEQETRLVAVETEMDTLTATAVTLTKELARAQRFAEEERDAATQDGVVVGADNAEKKPVSFGEFLQGVAYFSSPGNKFENVPVAVKAAMFGTASGASSGVSADGGFLVRNDWSTALMDKAATESQLYSKCMHLPIGDGFDGLEAPFVDETNRSTGSRWGGVQVYRIQEADTVTAKKPKVGLFSLRLEDLMGLFYATNRLLRDTTLLEALAKKAFPSEMAFKLDDEILRGNGAGQCLGVISAPCTVSQAKVVGQANGTVKAENVIAMYARLLARNIGRAEWYINQELLPQLMTMSVAVGTAGGQLVYMPPGGLTTAPFGTLLGRPVNVLEQSSGLGTLGDIIFADFSEYLLIDKPSESAESMHVRFIYNEMTFKWTWPIIGKPLLSAAITPYKATTATTLSPFVTLAAR